MIYLDNNATTPVDERVLSTMLPFFTQHFGNAASKTHAYGWYAESAVDIARTQISELIGAQPSEIVFTSGATESINLAIKGVFDAYSSKGNHIITCSTEHKAVLDTCATLEKKGAEITYLPVNEYGHISLEQLKKAIKKETILIALLYANNETGVLNPVSEIAGIAKTHNILFFCDATQAAGKVPINVINDGVDLLSLSAHKIYGPKGVGALYVRRKNPRVSLVPQIDGGGHERGFRSGTLNVPGIVGFGKAAELCTNETGVDAARITKMRNFLESELLKIEGTLLNGDAVNRLPNVCNISFPADSNKPSLIKILAQNEIAVSSGSACNAASSKPSHVLRAMGRTDEQAANAIRFSLGRFTTDEEIKKVLSAIV